MPAGADQNQDRACELADTEGITSETISGQEAVPNDPLELLHSDESVHLKPSEGKLMPKTHLHVVTVEPRSARNPKQRYPVEIHTIEAEEGLTGFVLYAHKDAAGRILLKHGVGNIHLMEGRDLLLSDPAKPVYFQLIEGHWVGQLPHEPIESSAGSG